MVWRQANRQAQRQNPRKYYKKNAKTGKVQGQKDLHATAKYTRAFAEAVFQVWFAAYNNV